MAQEKGTDPFHDSESEDVYDLYIACNGIVRDGLLDIRELDKLSPEEAEVLDVEKLKEIWAHTAAGCPQCAEIIDTLNIIRGTLGECLEDCSSDEIEAMGVSVIDSIS